MTALLMDGNKIAGRPFWSVDAKSLFIPLRNGKLWSVSVPDLVVRRELDLGSEISSATLCKSGLVVGLNATPEIVLVDPESLTAKKRLRLGAEHEPPRQPSIELLPTFEPSDGIVCGDPRHDLLLIANCGGQELRIVDMAAEVERARLPLNKHFALCPNRPGSQFNFLNICFSHDGRRLLAMHQAGLEGAVDRFQIADNFLAWQDSSAFPNQAGQYAPAPPSSDKNERLPHESWSDVHFRDAVEKRSYFLVADVLEIQDDSGQPPDRFRASLGTPDWSLGVANKSVFRPGLLPYPNGGSIFFWGNQGAAWVNVRPFDRGSR